MAAKKEFGVSYFSNRNLKHFKTDLQNLKKDGFNAILHTYSEEDFLWHTGNLKDMCKMSKDMGFSTWIDPWGVGKVFGGEALSRFLLDNHDCWQVLSNGKQFPVACMNNPKFMEYMKKWVDNVLPMEIDYIFWDEPHFAMSGNWLKMKDPEFEPVWGCRCDICKGEYKKMTGKPMPLSLKEAQPFRSLSIKKFLTTLTNYAKKQKPSVKISICLVSADNPYMRSATFEDMAQIKNNDGLGVDPYWFWIPKLDVYAHNKKYCDHIKKVCDETGKEAHFWLQGFKIPEGRENELVLGIRAAEDAGIDRQWVWGYEGCHMMSSLTCANPEKAWKIIVKEFKRIAGK